ncbi:hypothetical protein [Bradyrhizobium sp. CCBAU 53338]|uniref:hypothetical protein n=1 Tax=Bradyrhizobium sp. CCBAU 53338 TaxID=1325111 RepID=UPI00188AA8C6|nr:hypothetical protein [Bradyrhizobium sp. CCBAU 53338]QOZ54015.1 hypothetical protein XH90_23580 [Bradyrhizobium sp. CCBAU 53338]
MTTIWDLDPAGGGKPGRAALMAAQYHEMTEQEYADRLRALIRIVSASTLGLCSFAAGLLIGAFFLF